MSFTYIASPYSHPDPAVRQERFEAAMAFTADMLNRKVWCYSPIVHCHELALRHKLPYDFNFWQAYNRAMIQASRHLIVLQLDGWATSVGVSGEITIAKDRGIPVSYMTPMAGGYQIESNQNPRVNTGLAKVED